MLRKSIIIGLDGGSWNLLEPWINQGHLPNISKLLQNGIRGKLRSCIPSYTIPAWKCYSTGKNPAKLGVWDAMRFDKKTHKFIFNDSRFYDSLEIWDYLNEVGVKVGVINMPTTYPPKKINGFMICGVHSPENAIYTYPANLKKTLQRKYRYRIHPALKNEWEALCATDFQEVRNLIQTRFDVAMDYLEQVHLLHLTIFYIDSLQHFYWDGHEVKKTWKLIDENIGRFIDKCDNIFLVSDHGFTKLKYCFDINLWLKQNRYLVIKEKRLNEKVFSKLKISRQGLRRIASSVRIKDFIPQSFRDVIRRNIPEKENRIIVSPRSGMTELVDWEKTKGVALGESVYISPEYRYYREIQNDIAEQLKEVKDPDTGENIIDAVLKKEDLISQSHFRDRAPDLLIVLKKGYMAQTLLGEYDSILARGRWVAAHRREGIFVASGEGIKRGKKIRCEIIDIAPTILQIFGVAIPDDMDGKPLDIFEEPKKISYQRGISKKFSAEHLRAEEQEEIERRLRGLGYLE